jgi:hypothetical protein
LSGIIPKFMAGVGVLSRINDMRARGGLPDLETTDAMGTVPEPTEAGGGEFGGGGASDSWDDEPESPAHPSATVGMVDPRCVKDVYDTKALLASTLIAPVLTTAYQAWKRDRFLQRYEGVPCNGKTSNQAQNQACFLKKESDRHQSCFGDPLGARVEDTVEMMGRRHPWSYPVTVIGALAAGYYGYKEDKGWTNTLTWAGVGLAFPLIVGGFALYKQVRKK